MSMIRFLVVLMVLVGVSVQCAPAGSEDLEVRTFELGHLSPEEAVPIIQPYVYGGREGAPGAIGVTERLLTIREREENLQRIAEVLAKYDQPSPMVTLQFQIIEANGFEGVDPEIQDIEAELRQLLRYRGYRLLASPVVHGTAGSGVYQRVAGRDRSQFFELNARLGAVHVSDVGGSLRLEVILEMREVGTVLSTTVTVRDGQSMVLGTGSAGWEEDGRALILVVKPTFQSR